METKRIETIYVDVRNKAGQREHLATVRSDWTDGAYKSFREDFKGCGLYVEGEAGSGIYEFKLKIENFYSFNQLLDDKNSPANVEKRRQALEDALKAKLQLKVARDNEAYLEKLNSLVAFTKIKTRFDINYDQNDETIATIPAGTVGEVASNDAKNETIIIYYGKQKIEYDSRVIFDLIEIPEIYFGVIWIKGKSKRIDENIFKTKAEAETYAGIELMQMENDGCKSKIVELNLL